MFHTKGEGQHCHPAPPLSSRVAAGPRLPDWAGRGRDPFFSPPAKVRARDWALENNDCCFPPQLGVRSGLTAPLPHSELAVSLRLEMSFLGEMSLLRKVRVNSTTQIPCGSRSRCLSLRTLGVRVSDVFVTLSYPPNNRNNKGTRFRQPIDLILRISTSLLFPSGRWNRPLPSSWLLYGMCHLWRGVA